jgi:hypothetical protein
MFNVCHHVKISQSESSGPAKIIEKFNPSVKSEAEALLWKEEQCEASEEYKANQKRCMKKKDKGRCTMNGACFFNRHENRNICKYCYRFLHTLTCQIIM